MVLSLLPADKRGIVLVRQGRCIVARYVETAPYEFATQFALNWETLEPDARQAVIDQAGAPVDGDRLPCPDDLAARAAWPQGE